MVSERVKNGVKVDDHQLFVNSTNIKKVCVIGAGASGLVAARELRKEGHKVIVFEQNDDVGGQWLYDPNVQNEHPLGRSKFLNVHSSIYSSLRIASPREIMGFSDFPFVAKKFAHDSRRFPGHYELFLYLKDFCRCFDLNQLIRFNTRVEYVGMDKWKRKQIHSHVYRVPDPFCNEVVVVVGNSQSGQDISLDLIEVAKEIHLSTKSLDTVTQGLSKVIQKYQNLHLQPQIESLEEDGRVVFVDGSSIVADTILYCTGYSYAFPFLDTKGIVVVDDDRVGPLYEHTFPPSLAPSLSFIGIPRKLIGFPFFESQAIWIAQLLSGKRTLPSYDDMMQSIKQFYHSKDIAGIPKHNTHDLAEFEYCDRYGDNVGFPHLEEWRKKLCVTAIINSSNNLETFRDLMDDDEDLQEAYQSPHFTQLGAQVFPLDHM
ncbi:flavin-containing monooxygenase FMO GS-OX-like 9 [Cucumis melo var. makuwa]|uniref:Flavin-containing monooxygenase n=1 Tax=Cucumis melo var. makuwa TaxID=1194695 RepID=A0A5D3BKM4_CUCMM|nr:flavin-containing monooxygenase FMO GS-OX-like 9 [Cucumis melo var. makuwa]